MLQWSKRILPPKYYRFSTKIYTKKGDSGLTSILTAPHERVRKDEPVFGVLGGCDELSSFIGLSIVKCKAIPGSNNINNQLLQIQRHLQDLNSSLAAPNRPFKAATEATAQLESEIDTLTAQMPELREFLLPGGGEAAATIHIARAICRRVERDFVQLESSSTEGGKMFLNRLSDYLFTLARFVNYKTETPDISYKQ